MSGVDEFAVREVLGVTSHPHSSSRIRLQEYEHMILLDVEAGDNARLSPSAARRLARQLYRLARRIEERQA